MCERCDRANANLVEHRERIDKLVQDAKDMLDGNYTEDQNSLFARQGGFPEEKPFMEILYRLSCAASFLATANALITGEVPSMVLGEWAGISLETELESGIRGGALSIIASMLGNGSSDDEPTILH